MLIDRGVVRYDMGHWVALLKTSAMHNVLTPVLPGNVWPDGKSAIRYAGR